MPQNIPIPKIKKHERLILSEVYTRNLKGERVLYNQVWRLFRDKIPNDFRPEKLNSAILSSDGERIGILGIMALEKNRSIARKIDTVVNAIKQKLFEPSSTFEIDLTEIATTTNLPLHEVMFICSHLIKDYTRLFTGFKNEAGFLLYKTVVAGDNNMETLYNFNEYLGIEKLLYLRSLKQEKNSTDEYFNESEIITISDQIDKLISYIVESSADNESYRNEIIAELSEMKPLLPKLKKKNWKETFIGKLVVNQLVKYLLDPLVKKIIDFSDSHIRHFINEHISNR